jgi:hypothetical protein
MKHLQTFESFLQESQNTDLYSDETFEYFLQLAEGVQPDSKDDMRISDIVKKSAGNETKEISLAQQMAKSIKDGEKALRRARAAFAKGLSHIAKPFYDKAKDLGYSYHFSDAELQMEKLEPTEELSEGRSINKIQDEWTKHTSKMKETAAEWKESSGKTKDSLLAKLKEMTQKKKEIEKELYDAISFQDKDLELALESLGLISEEALSEAAADLVKYVESVARKTFTGGGNGQNILDSAMELASHIESYQQGRNTRGYEEDGFYGPTTITLFKRLVDQMSADDIKNNQG